MLPFIKSFVKGGDKMTDINSRDINNSSDSEASMSTVEARPESVKKAGRLYSKKEKEQKRRL